ncbi:hypothetical protein BSM4216_0114 [Bacillus smithii]|jgi:hypothetical protein|nr:hypothetical protein BSM4216_0114 [Bacillus smithii]
MPPLDFNARIDSMHAFRFHFSNSLLKMKTETAISPDHHFSGKTRIHTFSSCSILTSLSF